MFHGSAELHTVELAARVCDDVIGSRPSESYGTQLFPAKHVGASPLDKDVEDAYFSSLSALPEHRSTPKQCESAVYEFFDTEVVHEGSLMRQLYNEKLRGSVQAIITALLNELPRDHILLQLVKDPSTEQYCRVRVGEVVEAFLFSAQAYQYHGLASELAKRDGAMMVLAAKLEAAEQQLDAPATQASVKSTQTENCAESNGVTADNTPSNRGSVSNEVASAQAELFALLDEVNKEHELAKFRECLSAPTSLLETVQAIDKYGDRYEYLSDVVDHLFRSIRCLISYAEGTLNNVSAPFQGIPNTGSVNGSRDASMGRESPSPLKLPGAEGWSPLTIESNTFPRRNKHDPQAAELLQRERDRIKELMARLQYAESHCRSFIENMSTCHKDLCKNGEMLQHHLQAVVSRGDPHNLGNALRANEIALTKLREDIREASVAEREKADNCRKELQQSLVRCTADLEEARESLETRRQQLNTETERRHLVERQLLETLEQLKLSEGQLKAERDTLLSLRLKYCEDEEDAMRKNVELTEGVERLRVRFLVERFSAVNYRVNEIRAQIECAALNGYTTKMSLLQQHGYVWALSEQWQRALLAEEAMLHSHNHATSITLALHEQGEVMRCCRDNLRELLECMREDERHAESQQRAMQDEMETRGLPGAASEVKVGGKSDEEDSRVENMSLCVDIRGKQSLADEGYGEDEEEGNPAKWHRTFKALSTIVVSLPLIYKSLQKRQRHIQRLADVARGSVRQQREEINSLRAQLKNLFTEYNRQREELEQSRVRHAECEQQQTLKGLLEKRHLLLTALERERDTLHRRWVVLNEEYQALEKRNSQLHERCAAKEIENVRLIGLLHARHIAPSTPTETRGSVSSGCFIPFPGECTRPPRKLPYSVDPVPTPGGASPEQTKPLGHCAESPLGTPHRETNEGATLTTASPDVRCGVMRPTAKKPSKFRRSRTSLNVVGGKSSGATKS